VILREFVLGDVPAVAEIRNASMAISPDFYSMTVDRFRYDFYDVDKPMTARLMVAIEDDGQVAGFYHLYRDQSQLARGRVNLDSLHIHPRARNHGVGALLLASAIETARAWNGRYISTAIPEQSPRSVAFLERHGFFPARTFQQWRLNGLTGFDEPHFPAGFALRRFQPGQDEARFVGAFNSAFKEHWDFTPLTEAEVVQWNRRADFQAAGCFILEAKNSLVGFTTVLYDPTQAAQTGEAIGRIFEMGVLPELRQQHLGYGLLLAAIHYAGKLGFQALDLVADSQNAAALKLYEKVGFQEKRQTQVLHRLL
jgi:mycothiol synthase